MSTESPDSAAESDPSATTAADPVPDLSAATVAGPPPATAAYGTPTAPTAPVVENVGRGLLFACIAVVAGVVASVLLWKVGFIASITSLLIAAGAAWLYARGAGTDPTRGLWPLIALIIVGVVIAFLAVVASDLSDYWSAAGGADAAGESRMSFVLTNVVNPDILSLYGRDMAFYGLFALLGIFTTMRRLVGARGAAQHR